MQEKKLIWIDCDPGHDDYLALVMALNHPSLECIGISTTFGNSDLKYTTQNTLNILELMKIYNVEVYQGQDFPLRRTHQQQDGYHGLHGLCMKMPETNLKAIVDPQNIYKQIFNKLKQVYEQKNQKIIIIGLAGHTNIAQLFELHPESKNYVESFIGMYGGVHKGNTTPSAEANAYNDPEATFDVLKSGVKQFMAPLDLDPYIHMPDNFVDKLKKLEQTEFIKLTIEDIMYMVNKALPRPVYDMMSKVTHQVKMVTIYDLTAVFYLLDEDACETQFVNVEMELQSDLCLGQTVVDIRKQTDRKPNVHVITAMDNEKLYNTLFECIERTNNRLIQQQKK